jgi:hypothetical protein
MFKTRAVGHSAWSPFRGWMKWHHVMGLFASVIVLFWMLSGWLSMDHGRLFSKGLVSPEAALRFQGIPLDTIARAVPPELLPRIGPASEVRFGAVAGGAFVAARGGNLPGPKIFWLDTPDAEPTAAIQSSLLVAGLKLGWPQKTITQDAPTSSRDFYAVAESLGSAALPFDVGESRPLRIYVDSVTGRVLVVMDTSRRAYAWVYYALHTLNFPGLLEHDTARATLALALLLIGLTFSGTGAVLGYRRLRRSFST